MDEGSVRLEAYALGGGGTYVLGAELGPDERGALGHPWPVTVDMTDFVLPGR